MIASAPEAAADRALLRVLRRMASPVRHDLAGGMLVPQMQLQMLRRRLQKPGATLETAIAGIDDALGRLQELRALHLYSASWLALHDPAPLGVDEAVRKAAIGFGLHFSAIGVSVSCTVLDPQPTQAAQPLHLLVHACFFAVLDSDPAPGVLKVSSQAAGHGATIEWRLDTSADAGLPAEETDEAIDHALHVELADVQALCARYGCRFEHRPGQWTLHLCRSDADPGESPG